MTESLCIYCAAKREFNDDELCVLYFMRHGRTEHNALSICTGSFDEPLNEEGIQQANAAAHVLSTNGTQPQAVVSSPLQRAYATAQIIAKAFGLPVGVDERLRERCVGELEGKPETPESDAQLLYYGYLPLGATPLVQFEYETLKFLSDCIKGIFPSGTLFVTHSFRLLTIIKLVRIFHVSDIVNYTPPRNCEVISFIATKEPCSMCGSFFVEK
ncbi:MAG: putative phosphoglycerate mutase [Parcubacteria group bacterium Gr01-1014_70]|nr:MAG: putative phosphoglycerate mutase [Parcubacteria group bacterium Gr01-1014_70]